jgi:hypothetical protein
MISFLTVLPVTGTTALSLQSLRLVHFLSFGGSNNKFTGTEKTKVFTSALFTASSSIVS